jgi:L-iditol 2-dehydrogenase
MSASDPAAGAKPGHRGNVNPPSEPIGKTMNALVLCAVGDLRLQAIPRPPVPPGWVLVRVGFCGVCGSDIPRIFVKGTYHFPTVCGHEFAGTVEQLGEGVSGVAVGERVAVFPLIWCGKCPACEKGQFVQCADYDYFGSRRDGAFAQYVAVPRQNLLKVPAGVSLEEAAMTEPAAVALHALKRAGAAIVGKTVALFGAGPIGLMAAQWARSMGASDVLLFDIIPAKLDLARRLGFRSAFNSREQDPVKTVAQLTGGQGAHVAIDSAGVPQTLIQAMTVARRGGHVVLLGNPSGDVTVPAPLLSQLMRREVTLVGTWNSDYSATGNEDDWRTALSAMAGGCLDLKPLITHNVGLDQAAATLRMMKDNREFYAKVLIHP